MTRLYLSANTLVEPGDLLLNGALAVPALGAGAAASASVSVGIPTGQAPGQYYVIAKADADDVLFESQEGNNTRARFLLVGPDLIVSSLTVPTPATPCAALVVSDTVKNDGGGSAAASTVRFYLSANSTLDAGDTFLSGREVATLGPGASASGQTTLTIPSGLGMGTYYVIAEADGAKVVAETQETNNTAARAVQIGADLVVSALTVPAKGGSGAPVTVSDTTTNQGSEGVAPVQRP